MQVAVVFKSPLPGLEPNILNIKIQPTEGVYLQFNIKKPGESDDTIQAKMDFCQSCLQINQMNTPEAYRRLIGACILGNRAWFSSGIESRPLELCGYYSQDVRGARALSLSVSGRG